MLVELTVENLAIIERAYLAFEPGFTALTGETGAGKSLLVDAMELALGRRADSGAVRSGARSTVVHAVFDVSTRPEITALCADLSVPVEDGLLIVQREVFAEGRSQCRVGGRLCPIGTLRQLGDALIDLHGQHEHQALLDPMRHVESLDAWIGESAEAAKASVRHRWEALRETRETLADVRRGQREREQRLDLLRFQVDEIERVAPQPGEFEEVDSRLRRLQNVARLRDAAEAADAALTAEGGGLDALRAALARIVEATRLDHSAAPIGSEWEEAMVHLEDGLARLRHYLEALDADPEALESAAARLDDLKTLRRKYGDHEEAVLAFLDRTRGELEALEGQEASEETLIAQERERFEAFIGDIQRLSDIRRQAATGFAQAVVTHLRDLAMDRVQFEVAIKPVEPGPAGAETVEFFFSANRGEPTRPLAKVASGGEISRVMLAIKCVMAGRLGVPTLVFDEVDVGLGGRAAAAVAQKIADLAKSYQILVISHAPQLAARATSHIHVGKAETESGRVTVMAKPLSHEERVLEIARMMSGAEVTDGAMAGARELLGLQGSVR